ncbi:MAG: efflux RND transporter periplasmic adaptor subunit [Firmicutes bacterium]|nr:efflux RND transporter periplasmic adaptor subunit [Bacillota bacterium]
MLQRLLTILVIVLIVLGGGYYAYQQLIPPSEEEALGPVYATKPVTRGDITVGVEVIGNLNPSSGGGIQVPGSMYDAMSGSSITYVISEVLVGEGDVVQQGQLLVKLDAPDLGIKIQNLQSELEAERRLLADLLNVSVAELDMIDPSRGITLQAPIDGRVIDLTVREGESLKQGEIVARVVNDDKFILTAKVVPGELQGINVGDEALLSFSQFSGSVPAKVIDINPHVITERAADLYDSVGSAAGNDQYVFVHWVTLEGENPGLVQPGMRARIGVAKEDGQPLDEYNTRWLRYYAEVEGYAEEERVLSRADAIITRIYVRNMQEVKKGDPLISLAGDDAQATIQEKLKKIRELEQEIQQLYSKVAQTDIVSPMDGIVAYIDAQPGRTVQSGDWLGHIYTATDMRLSTEIDDIDILLVQQGSHVDVTVDAVPGKTFAGEVTHVSTMGRDRDGVTRFYVEIKVTGSGELRPGMQAHGHINAGSAENVLLVPLEAIFEEDGQSKVEVLEEDGSVRLATIRIGLMNDRFAEVKEGLEEGELVITGSTADLLPSQRIQSSDRLLPGTSGEEDTPSDEKN